MSRYKFTPYIRIAPDTKIRVAVGPAARAIHKLPHRGHRLHFIWEVHRDPFHGKVSKIAVGLEGHLPKRGGWYYLLPIRVHWSCPVPAGPPRDMYCAACGLEGEVAADYVHECRAKAAA